MDRTVLARKLVHDEPIYTDEIPESLRRAGDTEIHAALGETSPLILRGLLYFITGDESLGDIEVVPGPGFLTANGRVVRHAADAERLRERAFRLLAAYRDGTARPPDPTAVPRARVLKAIALTVGMDVPPEEFEYWWEEFGFEPWCRQLEWPDKPAARVRAFKVIVIGAGMGGISAAVALGRAGFDYQVFERNAGVGGTWYDNSYPGARVDLASRIYSHIFAVNYPWQHMFATAAENAEYANWVVDSLGVREHIRFDTRVESLTWDDAAAEWSVCTRTGGGTLVEHRANAVISAGGLFDRPWYGDLPGTERFEGVKMHTARYDPTIDLRAARVAVIGTGASSLQMVPDLADQTRHITVFQRTPGWVLPLEGYRAPLSEGLKWADANLPFHQNFARVAIHWLAGDHDQYWAFTIDPAWREANSLNRETYELRERCLAYIQRKLAGRPDLIEKCTPDYPPLTKRFVLDNGWYDALLRDDVELVDDPIDHIEENAIVTRDGTRIEVDAIIFATGYQPNRFLEPMNIRGRDGVTPQQVWAKDGARAYWGVTVPKLPNFFMVYGPGTNGKISGPLPWGEMQVRYALGCLKALIETGHRSIEVRKTSYDAFNRALDDELSRSIWLDPRQKSYYTNEFGRSATNSPWKISQMWPAWRRPDLDHYEMK